MNYIYGKLTNNVIDEDSSTIKYINISGRSALFTKEELTDIFTNKYPFIYLFAVNGSGIKTTIIVYENLSLNEDNTSKLHYATLEGNLLKTLEITSAGKYTLGEEYLSTATDLQTEIHTRATSDTSLRQAIEREGITRKDNDEILSTNIAQLRTDLGFEIQNRRIDTERLEAELLTESTTRQSVDNQLQEGINSLQADLSAEINRATEADQNLGAELASEIDRAREAENSLNTRIEQENLRAENAEDLLRNSIEDETNERIAADASLADDLQTLDESLATVAKTGDYGDLNNKPDLSDMATETWVGEQGFLTSSDISNMVTTDTDQTITGEKTFTDYLNSTGGFRFDYDGYGISASDALYIHGYKEISDTTIFYDPIILRNDGKLINSDSDEYGLVLPDTSDYNEDKTIATEEYVDTKDSDKEDKENKTTILSGASTDAQYPSAKAVYDNLVNVREVAEGKCKAIVLSDYYDEWPALQDFIRDEGITVKLLNGTDVTEDILNGTSPFDDSSIPDNYIFNSQDSYVYLRDLASGNLVCYYFFNYQGTYYIDTAENIQSFLKTGDNIFVIETDVPDRWYGNPYFAKLETGKVDISNMVTTNTNQEITGDKHFSGQFYAEQSGGDYYISVTSDGVYLGGYAEVDGALSSNESLAAPVIVTPIIKASWSNYGLSVPNSSSWTANKTIATTDQIPDLTNYVTTDTAQQISAPKSFYNNIANDTLPLRIQGFANKTWGLEMDKDFGRLHFKYADINGTNISNVIDHLVLDNSALYPAQNSGKDLGSSTGYKWRNLYLSGKIDFGTSITGNSNAITIANEDDTIPTILNIGKNNPYGIISISPMSSRGATLSYSSSADNAYLLFPNVGTFNAPKTLATTDQLPDLTKINNNFAPTYDNTSTYAVGDKVIYQDRLYKCTTAIDTAEAWNSAHWTAIKVSNGFVDLDTTQTISGAKNFTSTVRICGSSDSARKLIFNAAGDSELNYIKTTNGSAYLEIGAGAGIKFNSDISPTADTSKDIGLSGARWRNLYLSGNLSDGTNSVAVADIANKNNFVTLTQAEYDALATKDPNILYFIEEE